MGSEGLGRVAAGPDREDLCWPPPWLVDSGCLPVPTTPSLHAWLCLVSLLSEDPVTLVTWSPCEDYLHIRPPCDVPGAKAAAYERLGTQFNP